VYQKNGRALFVSAHHALARDDVIHWECMVYPHRPWMRGKCHFQYLFEATFPSLYGNKVSRRSGVRLATPYL
jgi:hypothetical protein